MGLLHQHGVTVVVLVVVVGLILCGLGREGTADLLEALLSATATLLTLAFIGVAAALAGGAVFWVGWTASGLATAIGRPELSFKASCGLALLAVAAAALLRLARDR